MKYYTIQDFHNQKRGFMRALSLLFMLPTILLGCKTIETNENEHAHDHSLQGHNNEVFASVHLASKSGSKAQGQAWFKKNADGVHVIVSVINASPGPHGIHIHEIGDCSAADASSAGPHYNPTHLVHGDPNPQKHHIGDLGNIYIDSDGKGTLDFVIPSAHFNPDYTDWRSIIGRSLVLHSKADDLNTQPAGDSGDRIACGVITAE